MFERVAQWEPRRAKFGAPQDLAGDLLFPGFCGYPTLGFLGWVPLFGASSLSRLDQLQVEHLVLRPAELDAALQFVEKPHALHRERR